MPEPIVFELARREHRRHLRLVDLALEASNSERGGAVSCLLPDLTSHARSEQMALISALLIDPRTRPLARRALAAHQELRRQLSDVSDRHGSAVQFGLVAYRARFVEYVDFEEGELFAAALAALGAERCERLHGRYEMAGARRIIESAV